MALARQHQAKTERLEVRLSPATKSLLSHAAQMRHTTVTDFLISSAVRAAEDVLVSPRVFGIGTGKGWNTLMALLDAPPNEEPNAALVALLAGGQPQV
jgi:uncharacterized protein (DUF1778 family)